MWSDGYGIKSCLKHGSEFLFTYQTPRVITMRNWKIALIFRMVQILLMLYLVGYVFLLKKSYQVLDLADSSVVTKIKGMLTRNTSNGPEVWDSSDFVVPSQESDAFFIATSILYTEKQSQGICGEDPNVGTHGIVCFKDADCKSGQPTLYGNGIMTGRCTHQTSTCEISGWCPTELDEAPKSAALSGFDSVTILVKNHVAFPMFRVKRRNILDSFSQNYLQTCRFHPINDPVCPIFSFRDIVGFANESLDAMATKGGIIGFNIQWNCDLDYAPDNCIPKYSFRRLDNKDDKVAKGWNFRHAVYYYDKNGTARRDLIKYWGIRFVMLVNGRAGKFCIVSFFMHLGSSIGLFGIATLVCELVLCYCGRSELLKEQKFKNLEVVKARRRSSAATCLDIYSNDLQELNYYRYLDRRRSSLPSRVLDHIIIAPPSPVNCPPSVNGNMLTDSDNYEARAWV